MLHTCQMDRAAVGGAAVGTARRLSGDNVANNVTPKPRSTNRLRLMSPKTYFATARPTQHNAAPPATAGVLQKTTSPMLAKNYWPTRPTWPSWPTWQNSAVGMLRRCKRERRAATSAAGTIGSFLFSAQYSLILPLGHAGTAFASLTCRLPVRVCVIVQQHCETVIKREKRHESYLYKTWRAVAGVRRRDGPGNS